MTTGIEWTDETWNPIRGCSRVSEGCRHCYAETIAGRFSGTGQPYEGLARRVEGKGTQWTGEVRFVEEALARPLRWKKPRRIFVNSMSDLFHEKVPDEWIDRIFAVMALCPQHTFQVLTKRPERMRDYITTDARAHRVRDAVWAWHDAQKSTDYRLSNRLPIHPLGIAGDLTNRLESPRWPPPNVHLGVSVEHPAAADERIPLLLQTPAVVRFVSYEPALSPVDFWRWLPHSLGLGRYPSWLDWIIVGGESGPGARPCDLAWIRSVVAQAKTAGVPAFVKQLGARPYTAEHSGSPVQPGGSYSYIEQVKLRDRKGGDPTEWPADLRVREFPR